MISSSLSSPHAETAPPDVDPEKALAALGNKLRWQSFQMMADGTPMHAAQGLTDEQALEKGLQEKADEFVEKGAEIYHSA